MEKIRVCIFEDNEALRKSLSDLISIDTELEFAGSFPNALHLLDDIEKNKPQVLLMDIGMPGISGIEAVALVRKEFPDVKVIMQTDFDDDNKVFQSICGGAVGYLLKKTPPLQMLEAIKQAADGGAPMSPSIATKVLQLFRQHHVPKENEIIDLTVREKEILTSLTQGMSYKMIAAAHAISIDTVRFHIKKIYEKLHVHSMTEAVSKALREKLI